MIKYPHWGCRIPLPSNKANPWDLWGLADRLHLFPATVRTGPACMPWTLEEILPVHSEAQLAYSVNFDLRKAEFTVPNLDGKRNKIPWGNLGRKSSTEGPLSQGGMLRELKRGKGTEFYPDSTTYLPADLQKVTSPF